MNEDLFKPYPLPDPLIRDLRLQNPWWVGQRPAELPRFRRWAYARLLTRLKNPLAPILVLRGPRQVGKTTLLQQVLASILDEGVAPSRILRVQFDELASLRSAKSEEEPILRIVDWFERDVLKKHLNAAANAGQPAYLFFDEVQNLSDWAAQLKTLVDHAGVRVLVTGSSALRIEKGRDSLAGRIQTIDLGPLRLCEIAEIRKFGALRPMQSENGWADWLSADFWRGLREAGKRQAKTRDRAFAAFSERGAYPFAHKSAGVAWTEIADHLVETVVQRVIRHDIRAGKRTSRHDEQLLSDVFLMACRWVGQAPNPGMLATEAGVQLGHPVGPERIKKYIQILDNSLLLRAMPPLEMRMRKKGGAFDKICLSDHSIRAAWLKEIVPLHPAELDRQPHLSDIAGRVAESTAGYFFASLSGLDVAHLPEREREPEVDFVLTIGERRIPVEVKYQRRIDPFRDTLGLRVFLERSVNNAAFGLLVTRDDGVAVDDPRLIALPLKTLLMVR